MIFRLFLFDQHLEQFMIREVYFSENKKTPKPVKTDLLHFFFFFLELEPLSSCTFVHIPLLSLFLKSPLGRNFKRTFNNAFGGGFRSNC